MKTLNETLEEIEKLRTKFERLKSGLLMMCAYCDFELPEGSNRKEFQLHISQCVHHPLAKENESLKRELKAESEMRTLDIQILNREREAGRVMRETLMKITAQDGYIIDEAALTASEGLAQADKIRSV